MPNYLDFPLNFYWGASTASHQVEGGNTNDWSEWEKSPERKKSLEEKGLIDKHGLDNFICGNACNHFNLYKEDFKMAKDLGHNATRISIEWSRIEPEEGKFSEEGLNHYKNVIKTLRELGIEPFVTLWHWPLPLWLKDKGGWGHSGIKGLFARYSEKVVSALSPDVKFWITLNEPEIYSGNSYLDGNWPPQKKNLFSYLNVLHNLIGAHNLAYPVIKQINPNSMVGIAKNNIYFEAAQNKFFNRIIKSVMDFWWNFYFLNKISKCQDFIGLNHYFHNRIDGWLGKNLNEWKSDMGWELYPEAIYHVLMDLKRYNKPVIITENGLADAKDLNREKFLSQSLFYVHKAISDGVPVFGYLHWSLMDNFEWAEGFWPRFGLVEIDYTTFERKPRPSSQYYKSICVSNTLPVLP